MVDSRPGPGPERAGAPEDTHPPGRREQAIAQWPARPAIAQLAGTTAAKVTGALSQPLTIWLTWTNTFMSAAGAPYRVVYRLVMSAEPCTAAGHVPSIRKSVHFSKPWLSGFDARTMVFSPGLVGVLGGDLLEGGVDLIATVVA